MSAAAWLSNTRNIDIQTEYLGPEPPIHPKRVALLSVGGAQIVELWKDLQATAIGPYCTQFDLRKTLKYISDNDRPPPHRNGTAECTINAVYRLPGFVKACQEIIEAMITTNWVLAFVMSDHGGHRAEVDQK